MCRLCTRINKMQTLLLAKVPLMAVILEASPWRSRPGSNQRSYDTPERFSSKLHNIIKCLKHVSK